MFITDYFSQIEKIIADCPAVIMKEITCDKRTNHIGLIKGILTFQDSSQLHFKEFIDTQGQLTKYKYGYHYQKENKLIFRYDNHIHSVESNLPSHHKHLPFISKLIPIESPPALSFILKEIIFLLP